MLVDVRFECANLTRYRQMHYFSLSLSRNLSLFFNLSYLFGCSAKNIDSFLLRKNCRSVDNLFFSFIVVNFTFSFRFMKEKYNSKVSFSTHPPTKWLHLILYILCTVMIHLLLNGRSLILYKFSRVQMKTVISHLQTVGV